MVGPTIRQIDLPSGGVVFQQKWSADSEGGCVQLTPKKILSWEDDDFKSILIEVRMSNPSIIGNTCQLTVHDSFALATLSEFQQSFTKFVKGAESKVGFHGYDGIARLAIYRNEEKYLLSVWMNWGMNDWNHKPFASELFDMDFACECDFVLKLSAEEVAKAHSDFTLMVQALENLA